MTQIPHKHLGNPKDVGFSAELGPDKVDLDLLASMTLALLFRIVGVDYGGAAHPVRFTLARAFVGLVFYRGHAGKRGSLLLAQNPVNLALALEARPGRKARSPVERVREVAPALPKTKARLRHVSNDLLGHVCMPKPPQLGPAGTW